MSPPGLERLVQTGASATGAIAFEGPYGAKVGAVYISGAFFEVGYGVSSLRLRLIVRGEPIFDYEVWDKLATFYRWPRSFVTRG
jgi:hypothetical protein